MFISNVGLLIFVCGVLMVLYDVFRIIRFLVTKRWTLNTAIVTAIRPGILFSLITFEYWVYSKKYKCSQNLIRNYKIAGLIPGSPVSIRVCPQKPDSAVLDHQQILEYFLLACLNSIWIIAGLYMFSLDWSLSNLFS